MAKGPIITEGVETLIARVYNEHPKWKAPEVQAEVSYRLHKKNPNLPPGWPSLSSVQKVLATVRKKRKEIPEDPLHKPWSIGTLDKYPIPADNLPSVLKVWKLQEEKAYKLRNTFPFDFPLTIREAKWVSRLCQMIPDDLEKLSLTATIYAEGEEISERLGHPYFDSTELDYDLVKPDRPLPDEVIKTREQINQPVTQSRDIKQNKLLSKEEVAKQEGGKI